MGLGDQTLFPPLVNAYMPAFLPNATARIYFSISPFNGASGNIHHVQLSLNYLNTNLSALRAARWPNEIKLCTLKYDATATGLTADYRYYIEINPDAGASGDLESLGSFASGQYYKAQLRFCKVAPTSGLNVDPGAVWYANNIGNFSEWSTVCILKSIPTPLFRVRAQPSAGAYDGSSYFIGQYGNVDSSEPLLTYRAQLLTSASAAITGADTGILPPDITYNDGTQYLVDASGNATGQYDGLYQSSSVYNGFYFRFKVAVTNATNYNVKVTYTTKSGYAGTYWLPITTNTSFASIANLSASGFQDSDNGRVRIYTKITSGAAGNTLTIRRSDFRTNFGIWEIVEEEALTAATLDKSYYDYTAESGILYKYMVNTVNASTIVSGLGFGDPFMVVYDDMFLVGNNKQLKIKYNPRIGNYKYVVGDSKVETLGSVYPYVRRNGSMKYRELDINGLISLFSDENNLFFTTTEIYGNYASGYTAYNTAKNIISQRDYIKEREFRNLVLDFLYDGNAKLFKSTTEGNIIVKLTNVSLTPIDTLGRMLYTFSATLTEIDEFTPENCVKYSLQVS